MTIHLTEDTRLVLPRELMVGRLLMIAFLAVVWARQVQALGNVTSTGRVVVVLSCLLMSVGWVWFWLWLAAAPEDWRQVVAVGSVTLGAIAMVSVNPVEVNPFYFVAVVAGAAFNWRIGTILVLLVTALSLIVWVVATDSRALLQPALVTLLFGIAAVIVRRVVAAQAALAQTQAELRRVAVDRARGELARDLHDDLGQQLTAVILQAELLSLDLADSPSPVRERAAAVVTASRSSLNMMRAAVTESRAPEVATEISSGAELLEATGVTCDVQVSTSVEGMNSHVLGWVVREAVTNVLRHSTASTCLIRLERLDRDIYLTIADNGVGPQGQEPGAGLSNMTARLADCGGSLRVESDSAHGFRLVAQVHADGGGGG
ncbi:MAG: histidine kinase [Actinomycetes bacterium]